MVQALQPITVFCRLYGYRQRTFVGHKLSSLAKKANKDFLRVPFCISKAICIRGCFHPGANSLTPLKVENICFAPMPKQASGRQLLYEMYMYVWPKDNWAIRRRVTVALMLLVAAKVLNVIAPFLLKDVINFYNDNSSTFYKLGVDSPVQAIATVGLSLILAYGAARVGSSLFNEMRNAIFSRVAQHSVRDIARKTFLHLHSLDLSFHLNRQTGGLSRAIDRGTRGMAYILNALVFNVVPTLIEVCLVTGVFYVNCGPEFAFATLACLSSYTIATFGITRWRTKFRYQMNQADNDAGNQAIDSLINYETVKYFNNEAFEANRYDIFLKKYENAALKTSLSLALLNFSQNAVFSVGLVSVMYLTASNIQSGVMTVGDLILANTLLFQLSIPLNFLGSVYREVRQGVIDMQTMFSLLNLKSSILEVGNAPPLNVSLENSTVEFRSVNFSYVPGKQIFKGLSFVLPAGKKVAIVGGSGSGKTTIIRLLYRLFNADSGDILINGQKINDVQIASLREAISVVPQDTVLFHGTIFYNLKYGNIEATPEEIYRAAKLANLHDTVLNFSDKYDTVVGERGLKLSGGEKQRVAIARAMLKNSPIIVYDEATSSLDALTEENIMNSMRNAFQKRTSLFIAHRLATVVDADIIYVLKNGQIQEFGSHEELLNKRGSCYAALWRSQHKYGERSFNESRKIDQKEKSIQSRSKCCSGNCNC